MNRQQAAILLSLAAARDRRTIGDADVMAWAEDLTSIEFDDAREAVTRHYRASTDWLMPAHVVSIVKIIREERRRAIPHEVRSLPSRFEPDEDRAERAHRGAALCREALTQAAIARGDAVEILDAENPIRNLALHRARKAA